jgi:hypothetical protein
MSQENLMIELRISPAKWTGLWAALVMTVGLLAGTNSGEGSALAQAVASTPARWSPSSAFLESTETSIRPEKRRLSWYKGNTHTHTIHADGDSTTDEVVKWYRQYNNFQFVVITDHNYLAAVEPLNAVFGTDGRFLVISGEEVSDRFEKKYVHLNGLNLRNVVPPQGGSSVADVIQRNADAIRKAGGVPIVNHPNFLWSIEAGDLRWLRDVRLLEIYSSNPDVANFGGGGKPSVEEIWDTVLSGGQEIYGTAADDAHTFKEPWNPDVKRPGLAWVVVRSPVLESNAVMSALERGEFYASTGVEIDDISVTAKRLAVTIKAKHWIGRTQFIGNGGRVLKEVSQNPADYTFVGDEGYVRARVTDGNGRLAWVQPTFLRLGAQ